MFDVATAGKYGFAEFLALEIFFWVKEVPTAKEADFRVLIVGVSPSAVAIGVVVASSGNSFVPVADCNKNILFMVEYQASLMNDAGGEGVDDDDR